MAEKGDVLQKNDQFHIVRQTDLKRVSLGIVTALIMAGAVLSSAIAFPGNQGMTILSIILVPFLLAVFITKNVVDALAIVWLNEMFFGVGGNWIKIGSIPGRGILLIIVLFMYILFADWKLKLNGRIDKTALIVIFYGTIFPLGLFFYGTIVGGATTSNALSDVMRFSTILMYFPLRDLFQHQFDFCFGFLFSSVSILSLLFVAMAIAPIFIRSVLLINWMSFGDINSQLKGTDLDFFRAGMTPVILCFIGVFMGIMIYLDSKQSIWRRLFGLFLTCGSTAPFVINFLRGPIVAISFSIFALILMFFANKVHRKKSFRLLLLSSVIVVSGYWISVNYLPISLTKWDVSGQNLTEILDPARVEQVDRMLDAWLDEPFFGKGVGIPLKDYSRDDSGLAFEVQYPMVLYRVGLIGFIIIMIPFGWLILRSMRILVRRDNFLDSLMGKLQVSIALSMFTLLISSWANPYFASAMTPLFFAMFLALNKIANHNQFNLLNSNKNEK